jgi:hypothetical protein
VPDRTTDLRGFVTAMEKHELGKIDFDLIDDAFTALLQSHPDPVTADKVADLRDKFRDALLAGWRLRRPCSCATDRGEHRQAAGAVTVTREAEEDWGR